MKVRRDPHSIYVRQGGYLFRPIPTEQHPNIPSGGRFQIGGLLKGRQNKDGLIELTRESDGRVEQWASHGAYAGKRTTELWQPTSRYHS